MFDALIMGVAVSNFIMLHPYETSYKWAETFIQVMKKYI